MNCGTSPLEIVFWFLILGLRAGRFAPAGMRRAVGAGERGSSVEAGVLLVKSGGVLPGFGDFQNFGFAK